MTSAVPVVSLFSGAGGLDLGVEQVCHDPALADRRGGVYEVAVATDFDASALSTLAANMPRTRALCVDIRELASKELVRETNLERGEVGLVVGGPPCTPFSKSGFWLAEKRESRDPNASLLDDFVRVVSDLKPDGVVFENVQSLAYKLHRVQFTRLLAGLENAGYSVGWRVLNAADFGVPQLRRRVFVLGRRDGGAISFPSPTHSGWSERDRNVDPRLRPYVSSSEAIGAITSAAAEDTEVVEGRWAALAAEIPPGHNYLWHTERGGGRNQWRWRSRYWTFLLRLDPNRPATTIQAQPGPWVGPYHWENVQTDDGERARRLRVPEILRLFTYPNWYQAHSDRQQAQKQIGNSVPVELSRVVTEHISRLLGHLGQRERPLEARDEQLQLAAAA